MKIDLRRYEENKPYHLEEEVDFSSYTFSKNYRIRSIKKCLASLDFVIYEDLIDMDVKLTGEVIGACSYTNEDVNIPFRFKEHMTFSTSEDSEDYYYEPGPIMDLLPYFLSLIDSNIPLNIHKPGAKIPEGGQGYEVLSEDDYFKKKKEHKGPSPWDALDKIKIDEEGE